MRFCITASSLLLAEQCSHLNELVADINSCFWLLWAWATVVHGAPVNDQWDVLCFVESAVKVEFLNISFTLLFFFSNHVNSKDVPFSQQTPDKSLLNFKIYGICFCITWEFLKVKHCASQQDFVLWSEEAEYKLCRLHPSAAWRMTWCLSKSQVIAPQRTHLKYLNVVEHEQLSHRVSKAAVVKSLCGWKVLSLWYSPPADRAEEKKLSKICPNTSVDCKWDEKAEREWDVPCFLRSV